MVPIELEKNEAPRIRR